MKKLMSLFVLVAVIGSISTSGQTTAYKMSERNTAFAQQMQKEFVDNAIRNMETADKMLQLSDLQKDEIVYIHLMYSKRTQILTDNGASAAEINQHTSNMMDMALNDYARVLNDTQKAMLNENREILKSKLLE
ncbi:MAG: hypothetical protein ACK4IY_01495 [Chitinophagales bacterium]